MKRWIILRELWLPFTKHSISKHAAATCYYILLSLLPGIALGLTIFYSLPISSGEWYSQITSILPEAFRPVVTYFIGTIKPRRPGALLSLWAVLTLWSASKGIMAMTDGMSAILGNHTGRTFISRRLHAMSVLLLLVVVLSGTLTVNVFGNRLLWFFYRAFPRLERTVLLLYHLRFLYTLLISGIFLALIYRLLPGHPLPFVSCLQCGFISSVGWFAASLGFSIYVNHFQSYQRLYGSLGLLLLASLWLQVCISFLFYGALLGKLTQEKAYSPAQIIRKLFT